MHLTAAQKSSSGFTAAANKPKCHSHWRMGSDKKRHTVLADSSWGWGCTVNQNTVLPERPTGRAIDDNHMQSSQAYRRSGFEKRGKQSQNCFYPHVCTATAHLYTFLCIYSNFKHETLHHNLNNNIYHFAGNGRIKLHLPFFPILRFRIYDNLYRI